MFAVIARFEIVASRAGEFLALARENAARSVGDEPGCHRFDVLADPDRPGEVVLYELYEDAAAFDAHKATAHFSEFDAGVAALVTGKTVATYSEVTS